MYQNPLIVHFTRVNVMVCEWYFNACKYAYNLFILFSFITLSFLTVSKNNILKEKGITKVGRRKSRMFPMVLDWDLYEPILMSQYELIVITW